MSTFIPGIHFLFFIMRMFCPSLIMVVLFMIAVWLLTPISSKSLTATAKLILGCVRTTSHEIILKELGLMPFFVHCQVHILIGFCTTLFRTCPSFISVLPPKFFKNLSDYSSRFHMNVQLPSWRSHSLHIIFSKCSKHWKSPTTAIHNLWSWQFCSTVSYLFKGLGLKKRDTK